MGTKIAGTLVSKAATLLHDEGNVRWSAADLLNYLNDGQCDAVLLRPAVGATTVSHSLVVGARQTLPADAIQLLDMVRNANGRGVRVIARDVLDMQVPDWYAMTPATTIINYSYDPRNPKVFYVYPPAALGAQVELVYAKTPAVVTAADPISIDDVYANALVDYMLFRAYSRDAEYAQNVALADRHYQAFAQALGVTSHNDLAHNPNLGATPFNPGVPGGAHI